MDPRNENASLEQRERDAVGHEVTKLLNGVATHVFAVSSAEDGTCPQFGEYLIGEMERLINEVTDYRRYLATKPRMEARRKLLIRKQRKLRALGPDFLDELKNVNEEIVRMAEAGRKARFPYIED